MALYRRGRVWFIDWVYRGTRYHQSTGCESKQDAKIALAQLQARVTSGKPEVLSPTSVPTLREFEEQFIEYIEAQCKSHPRTVEFYRQSYEKMLTESPKLAAAGLDKIDEALIDRYVVPVVAFNFADSALGLAWKGSTHQLPLQPRQLPAGSSRTVLA
jgi:hypothetical protein